MKDIGGIGNMIKQCNNCDQTVEVYERGEYVEVEHSAEEVTIQRYYFCQMECLYVWADGKLMASLGETLRNIKKGERD